MGEKNWLKYAVSAKIVQCDMNSDACHTYYIFILENFRITHHFPSASHIHTYLCWLYKKKQLVLSLTV